MIDHLPECPATEVSMSGHSTPPPDYELTYTVCICDRLRACEQRVEREWIEHCNRVEQRVRDESWDHGMEVGTHSALDAAREAVAGQCGHTKSVSSTYQCDHDRALAAIDALREEEK